MTAKRKVAAALVGVVAMLTFAVGCTTGSTVPTPSQIQSTSNTAPADSTTNTSSTTHTSTKPSTPSTDTKMGTTTAEPTSTGWTTPDYGDAKRAVDAYLEILEANTAGVMDPAHADLTFLEKRTEGQARDVMIGSIKAEPGTAWRGTPPQRRVDVEAVTDGVMSVVLTDCPVPSASWTQYDLKSGESIPAKVRTPPPPYLARAILTKRGSDWVLVDFQLDGSKTCTR